MVWYQLIVYFSSVVHRNRCFDKTNQVRDFNNETFTEARWYQHLFLPIVYFRLYIKLQFFLGWSYFLFVQRLINLGRDLASSSLELFDEGGAVLVIVNLVHHHHLQQQQYNSVAETHNLRYRVLHPRLVVVGVSLGPHLEVKGPEGSLGEDVVVLHLVPLESLPEILWTDTKNLLRTFLKETPN